ncbi:MAG: twin-arginine translocation signal domain-containing protein, partial [Terracidiphilus sp.]
MKSRREFLKEAAAGAVLLGSTAAAERLAFAGATAGKSKVVIARDASLHDTGAQPDEQRVLHLLDKAMAAYTGRQNPVDAWKSIIPANILAGKTIGLKVNGLGGRGISTHAALTLAIAERLQQAGVRAG